MLFEILLYWLKRKCFQLSIVVVVGGYFVHPFLTVPGEFDMAATDLKENSNLLCKCGYICV